VPGALALIGALLTGPALAGQSLIELRDGSTIAGALVRVEGAVYVIQSATLGEVRIPESEVLSIRPVSAGTPGGERGGTQVGAGPSGAGTPSAGALGGQIQDLQQQLTQDPQLMGAIAALQGDPQLRAALADPEFARAVLSGDLDALQQDPRFIELMRHPGIQEIVGRMTGR
jgi:hypothetical protein